MKEQNRFLIQDLIKRDLRPAKSTGEEIRLDDIDFLSIFCDGMLNPANHNVYTGNPLGGNLDQNTFIILYPSNQMIALNREFYNIPVHTERSFKFFNNPSDVGDGDLGGGYGYVYFYLSSKPFVNVMNHAQKGFSWSNRQTLEPDEVFEWSFGINKNQDGWLVMPFVPDCFSKLTCYIRESGLGTLQAKLYYLIYLETRSTGVNLASNIVVETPLELNSQRFLIELTETSSVNTVDVDLCVHVY